MTEVQEFETRIANAKGKCKRDLEKHLKKLYVELRRYRDLRGGKNGARTRL